MGNVGVASADIAAAPFLNPAMLSYQHYDDDFSFVASFGVRIDDSYKINDSLDEIVLADNNLASTDFLETDPTVIVLNNGGDPVAAVSEAITNMNTRIDAYNAVQTSVESLTGKIAGINAGVATSAGVAFEEYSFAVSARSYADIGVTVDINLGPLLNNVPNLNPNDPAATATAITGFESTLQSKEAVLNDTTQNRLILQGLNATEVGLSVAKNFRVFSKKLAVGVTPKIVTAELTTYNQSLFAGEIDDTALDNEDSVVDLGDFVTFDVGAVMEISDSTQVGLVIKNFAEHTITYNTTDIVFSRSAKLGVAYRGDFFRLGADLDLIEIDALLPDPIFATNKTKMVNIGAEINAWDFVQLRAGMQTNTVAPVGADDTLYTAGVGFWLGFNLDVTAMFSENSAAAMFNLGLKF